MRKVMCAILPLALICSGCLVPIAERAVYHKAVTVTKDADGNIKSIVVLEEITQSFRETVKAPLYLDE